ncbi:MAG: hypothetical protein KUA43_10865 [Hoeflea sp.]|uniref:hypothetical protein n=1 Tax=Hoeflea sp. TaxID=1940281 RepID=UPI001DA0B2B6|nr:hypothetical protein [Hoeflea sp.]MBU4529604.1 hypothetical protein [Alphaproteobacteria bacterium]MBU4546723.1 hypothetical protein [Alphaproteobacteria bacterium]MBU4550991.1 hypothetical protein [Alphaproteobacteria bacterium]MBV1723933.1 hypothetical protein [Hoeflea sp.]MBV1763210.1 hypothetical protein [Hoeflea sp.]
MAEPEDMSASLAEEILAELHNLRTTMNQGFDMINRRFDNIFASMDAIDALLDKNLTRFKNPESGPTK